MGDAEAPQARVLVFIDSPHFNAVQDEMGISVDFGALKEVLAGDRELVGIRYYTKCPVAERTKGFMEYLKGIGYTVIVAKPGMDVDPLIVNDINGMCDQADVFVLVGGDAIYVEPLKNVVSAKKKAEVVSPSTTVAGRFHEIATVIDPFSWKDRIADKAKTQRRQRQLAAAEARLSEVRQVCQLVSRLAGQLLERQVPFTVENRPPDIMIRIRLTQQRSES